MFNFRGYRFDFNTLLFEPEMLKLPFPYHFDDDEINIDINDYGLIKIYYDYREIFEIGKADNGYEIALAIINAAIRDKK